MAANRELVQIEKAKKLTVAQCGDLHFINPRDEEGFCLDVDGCFDDARDREPEDQGPWYYWPVNKRSVELDAYDIIEDATQDHHESVGESALVTKEFIAACEAWNELHKDSWTGEADYSRVLVIAKEMLDGP